MLFTKKIIDYGTWNLPDNCMHRQDKTLPSDRSKISNAQKSKNEGIKTWIADIYDMNEKIRPLTV